MNDFLFAAIFFFFVCFEGFDAILNCCMFRFLFKFFFFGGWKMENHVAVYN